MREKFVIPTGFLGAFCYSVSDVKISSIQASGLAKLMQPLIGRAAAWYQRQVGNELRKYGLRYEDLLDPSMSLVFLWE